MLTGDNERSASAIARRVGVDEYRAQLLPTDKVEVVRQLKAQYGSVAMVGDGINDAPAMAVADVGIAMGAAGTDIAIEAGDVVLMSDDLAKLAYVRELSHRTVSVIRQNIAVSLVNVAFMVIAALLGYLGLVSGLLLNEGSAVFVILNALRLLSWRDRNAPAPAVIEAPVAAVPEVRAAPAVAAVEAGGCCPSPAGTCSCGDEAAVTTPVGVADAAPCCCAGPVASSPAPATTADNGGCCCSCGDPPGAAPSPVAGGQAGLATATFRLEGLGCACEGAIVEKCVQALKGASGVVLNPITNQMRVTYDPAVTSTGEIIAAVRKAGATAVPVTTR
jgi:copper chaperone CopZ